MRCVYHVWLVPAPQMPEPENNTAMAAATRKEVHRPVVGLGRAAVGAVRANRCGGSGYKV